ncbi:MAG: hypothetical protein OCD76_20330 [Reichenbachiella sp.]
MKISKIYVFALIAIMSVNVSNTFAQDTKTDEDLLNETIDWLEKKINITYYNAQAQVWWTNRLFYNSSTHLINIKNTSADNPSFLDRGTYYDRKVKINDLDGSSIKVFDIDEDQGRIVYGQVVHVNVIGNQKRIQRTKNSKKTFNEFFLQIPVPHALDSSRVTADSIKVKLALAIELASKIKPSTNVAENATSVMMLLHGTFKGSDDSKMKFTVVGEDTYEIEHKKEEIFIREGLFGFDVSTSTFFLWTYRNSEGKSAINLNLNTTEKLILQNDDKSLQVVLHGENHFSWIEKNVTTEFFREEE